MQLFINEIFPNPTEGSEWIELFSEDCEGDCSFSNYKIFDSYHQIYKFDGQEVFSNQLLVIEVSGLNNDTDSVVLKDNNDNILDSFTYTKTEKGLSWSKDLSGNFFLTESSPNLPNPNPTPTPSPTISTELTPTLTTTITPTTSQPAAKLIKEAEETTTYQYELANIKLESHDQTREERLGKLVFLSKSKGHTYILNAIIGSSLVVLSSVFSIYVRLKNKNYQKLFSGLP